MPDEETEQSSSGDSKPEDSVQVGQLGGPLKDIPPIKTTDTNTASDVAESIAKAKKGQ